MADYSGAQQEIQQLKNDGISPSKLNAAYAAMTKQAADPSTSEKIVKEVQDLFDRAMAMNRSFEHIKIELGDVDAKEYKDKDNKPLEKLQPTWAGFQNVRRYSKFRITLNMNFPAIYPLDVELTRRRHRFSGSLARFYFYFYFYFLSNC